MTEPGFARELTSAIDELESSLQGALAAAARIRALAPQLAASTDVVREIEALLTSRQAAGLAPAPPAPPARRSIGVPGGRAARGKTTPPAPPAQDAQEETAPPPPPAGTLLGSEEPLNTFRLEIQCIPGNLDLRTVDEIVGDHPAVRDVALLDYDGRRATLKVWAITEAAPADIQEWIAARARNIFEGPDDLHITAIEDAA